MDNKEIVLFDNRIRVSGDWYVCVSDVQSAINGARMGSGLNRYNFSQWLRTIYVNGMISGIRESGKDAFKVGLGNESGKIEQYCHPGVFVNMVLSSIPVGGNAIFGEEWFNDYLCDSYAIDGHVYGHARILAIGGLWRYTTRSARFSDDVRTMESVMDSVPDGDKDAVYSLFFDLLGTFYYNWEIALRLSIGLLLGEDK